MRLPKQMNPVMKSNGLHSNSVQAGILPSGCPWWKEGACYAAVAAAVASCTVVGPACTGALTAVAKAGCCDCIHQPHIRELCKQV